MLGSICVACFSTQNTIVGVIPASHHFVMIEQIAGFCKKYW